MTPNNLYSMENTIQKICELLDQEQIRYLSIVHSKAYKEEEMTIDDYNLGNELIDSVLIRIDNEKIVMVIVPSTRKISLTALQIELNNSNISFIGKNETKKLFPDYEIGTLPPFGSLYNFPVFCLSELKRIPEVTFYLGTRAFRIRMKTQDFFKVIRPQFYINAVSTPRYRAEIHNVVPGYKKNNLKQYESCILGISLENKNFVTAKLVGMMEWVSHNFKSCAVLIGDSIHHHTLEIRGIDKNYAYDKALTLGRETIDANNSVFQSYAERCNLDIVLCSQIQATFDYYKHYAHLLYLYEHHEVFSNSLRAFSKTFVERRTDMDENYYQKSIEKSCIYIVEELAVFTCLSEQGYKVFVYPGALTVLIDIACGLYPDTPAALQELTCVELKIKRCGAS